jgi:hypothetical protein
MMTPLLKTMLERVPTECSNQRAAQPDLGRRLGSDLFLVV